MKEIHVVGAAIIDGTRVLAAQRSEKMKEPLKWEFPGGKIEHGETHVEALVREIREELGASIEVQEYITTGNSIFDNNKIHLHVYKAKLRDGKAAAKEHLQLKWIEIKEIEGLDWAEADIPACNKLIEEYV